MRAGLSEPRIAGWGAHSGKGRLSGSAMSSDSHELHAEVQPADVGEGQEATVRKAKIWSQLTENKLGSDYGKPVCFPKEASVLRR